MAFSHKYISVVSAAALLVSCVSETTYQGTTGSGGSAGRVAAEPGGNGGKNVAANAGSANLTSGGNNESAGTASLGGGAAGTASLGGGTAGAGAPASAGATTLGGTFGVAGFAGRTNLAGGAAGAAASAGVGQAGSSPSPTGGQNATAGVSAAAGMSATAGVTSTGGQSAAGGSVNGGATGVDCSGQSSGWQGCRGTGCSVCSDLVVNFPLYFVHHKNCVPITACENQYFECSANCPAPTEFDAVGGAECAGDTSGWEGCRASGCLVCQDLLTNYPKYLENHPNCGVNPTCESTYFACSSNCPAPNDADK